VLFAESTVESGLVTCLAEGFGVYERSISGLEFALRDAESRLVMKAIGSGEEGLREQTAAVRQLAADERAKDEGDSVLDEASFDRAAAHSFRRAKNNPELQCDLERAFVHYLELTGTKRRTVAEFHDEEFSQGIFRLSSDGFHHLRFPAVASDNVDHFLGTFRREIAQRRLDVQFLSLGNPYFDAVVETLGTQPCGRTYAIEVLRSDVPRWVGFEFVFRIALERQLRHGHLGLFNRVEQLLERDPLSIFVSADGSSSDGAAIAAIRSALAPDDKERTWRNLTKQKANALPSMIPGSDWRAAVERAHGVAAAEATRQFAERLQQPIADEQRRLTQLSEFLMGQPDAEGEVAVLREWIAALQNWTVALDACGFLSMGVSHSALPNAGRRA
jgi:ATP-dependent helicase HepA